jgi:hypothetical protein
MKRILREDHAKLLLHVLTVLFLGLCILFSGGIYESMGKVFGKGSGEDGVAVEIKATLNKFTGEIRINRVVCRISKSNLQQLASLSDDVHFCKAFDSTYD